MKVPLKHNKDTGVTFVEMLVVFAMVGLVAAVAVPVIGNMTNVASSTSASIRMTNEIQGGCIRMLGILESG